jgi:hypothetical protein
MKRVKVDSAAPAVKEFLRGLPLTANGVELELGGRVIGKLIPPSALSEHEKAALIARGRELVKRARARNKGVPARVLQRDVDSAVREVRRRQRAMISAILDSNVVVQSLISSATSASARALEAYYDERFRLVYSPAVTNGWRFSACRACAGGTG